MVTFEFDDFVHSSVSSRPPEKLANTFLKKASAGDVLLADGAAYEVQSQNYSMMRGASLNTRGLGSDSYYRISTDGDVLSLASGQTLSDATLVKVSSCRKCGGETEFVDPLSGIGGVKCVDCDNVNTTL